MVNILKASATLLSGIIFPLYFDPGGTSCSSWQPLIEAATSQPDLPFYTIVNPDSGPGSATPTKGYQTCIPSLRASNPNVKIIGYVATGGGTRKTQGAVEAEVDLYAEWGSTYRPDGIFFDEAATTTAQISTYQTYSNYVASKSWFTTGETIVILNPGTTPNSGYYSITGINFIVSFEDKYNTFAITDLTIGSSTPASKQAVILHTAPSGSHASVIDDLVTDTQIAALYITEMADDATTMNNPYNGFSADWTDFVEAVVDAQ